MHQNPSVCDNIDEEENASLNSGSSGPVILP